MVRLELNGSAVAPGIGVGPAVVVASLSGAHLPRLRLPAGDEAGALARFEAAHARALARLDEVQGAAAQELGLQDAAIYGAQAAVLRDPHALADIRRAIREERLAPASAIQDLLDRLGGVFEAMEGGDMKSWAADLRDPWMQVLEQLEESAHGELLAAAGSEPVVLIADELTPSLLARLPRARIAGVIGARGGRFSHGAVVARAAGVPAIAGVDQACQRVRDGEVCIVHGDEGRAQVGVAPAERIAAQSLAADRSRLRDTLAAAARQPARTADGTAVEILANIESPRDLDIFDAATVDGIGLFRTEFAYMERPSFPSAEEQARLYGSVLERMHGRPVTFRSLDVGADKQLRYLTLPRETNPALGWRGLRLGLVWQDILLLQLQAFLAAAPRGDARILLPMVTIVEEVRAVRALLAGLAGGKPCPPLGAMIEVPAAVMGLRDLLRETDFVSVGTNDLTQYLFAVDRDNPWVASLYQPYHPAHLRLLRNIARTCTAARKPVSVCGELAGQPAGALFLVGAGFRSLSMAPTVVPEIKALLRASAIEALKSAAARALRCRTVGEASSVLDAAVAAARQRIQAAPARSDAPGVD